MMAIRSGVISMSFSWTVHWQTFFPGSIRLRIGRFGIDDGVHQILGTIGSGIIFPN